MSLKRFKAIVAHFDANGIETRKHGLAGKCSNNTRHVTHELRIKVVSFIKNFAAHWAVPLPGWLPQCKNYKVMKLPTNITKIAVYRRYIESVEKQPENKISERLFYQLWHDTCPYIETLRPSSDLCDTCRENSIHISSAKNADQREERLNNALHHLQRAKGQRTFY